MREKLPERRIGINLDVPFKNSKVVITIGYDSMFLVKEVFCADFKAGSDSQAVVMDACILLSRLFQHGDTPQDILKSMCEPRSLIGTICQAICDEPQRAKEALSAGIDRKGTNHADDGKNTPATI